MYWNLSNFIPKNSWLEMLKVRFSIVNSKIVNAPIDH